MRSDRQLRRVLWTVAACLLALVLTESAEAQAVAPLVGSERPERRAWLELGWDPSWMASAGGSQRLVRRNAFELWGDVALRVPMLLLPDNGELGAGASLDWVVAGPWRLVTGLHPDLRLARDTTGMKLGFGSVLSLRPGYYAPCFTLAADLAASSVFTAYVRHSAAVRELFEDRYPEGTRGTSGPHDGFYALSSHRLRAGVAGGARLGRVFVLHGAFGFAYTPQLDGIVLNPPYGPLPFYVSAGGQYLW